MDCNQQGRKSTYLMENTWEEFPYHGKTHAQVPALLKKTASHLFQIHRTNSQKGPEASKPINHKYNMHILRLSLTHILNNSYKSDETS